MMMNIALFVPFEACQDKVEKSGGQNDHLLIMFFRTSLTAPMSKFQHSVICNKESWEKGDITDPLVLMNDEESKFRSLQEDKLWVTNNPTKANILALTTVIGNLTNQLDSKGTNNEPFGNSNPSTVASGNNESTTRQNLDNRSQCFS